MKETKLLGSIIVRFGEDNLEIRKVEINVRDNNRTTRYFIRVLPRIKNTNEINGVFANLWKTPTKELRKSYRKYKAKEKQNKT